MPLQFDVSEVEENQELKYEVTTRNRGTIKMSFDASYGGLRIEGAADDFWRSIEKDLDYKIQFDNL